MGDSYGAVKVAAVQAASVFLDREGSTGKACRLIREAGKNGARVIGFPEGFIPAHPVWFHFHPATGEVATRLSVELFKNAVEIPGPEINELQRAAADAGSYVVVGVCEKLPNTTGTLYNSLVFLGPDGALLGKRRKLMPTVGERLVRVAVHQAVDAVGGHRRFDGGRRDVGDHFRYAGLVLPAGRASLRGECLARGQRLGQEVGLPGRVAHLAAEGLVGQVVAAQQVAVHQRQPDAGGQGHGQHQHEHREIWGGEKRARPSLPAGMPPRRR